MTFTDLSYSESVDRLRGMLRTGVAHQVVLGNAHTLNLAYVDPGYRRQLQEAALVLRDGVGVKLAALAAGRPLMHNFVGTDFVPSALADLAADPLRVFLFGGKPGIAEAAGRELERRCRAINVVGCQHGYLPEESWPMVVDDVNRAAPDVLLVALGNPLQEAWIAEHLPHLRVRVAIGVGALLDYLADAVPRAPWLLRRIGLEWVFRLLVEPRRLWRRYLIGNVQFLHRTVLRRVLPSAAAFQ